MIHVCVLVKLELILILSVSLPFCLKKLVSNLGQMGVINNFEVLIRFLQNSVCSINTNKLSLYTNIGSSRDKDQVMLLRRHHGNFSISDGRA
mmetsp:Transcript_21779/g.34159  ORF Transcript_21779/g.34159 Transcript_21779/m.34159 type:complete len:92 (+) Transcript_21779:2244-2519(+)